MALVSIPDGDGLRSTDGLDHVLPEVVVVHVGDDSARLHAGQDYEMAGGTAHARGDGQELQ